MAKCRFLKLRGVLNVSPKPKLKTRVHPSEGVRYPQGPGGCLTQPRNAGGWMLSFFTRCADMRVKENAVMTMPKMQLCSESMPDRDQAPEHLLSPGKAIKMFYDELEWAESFTPTKQLNAYKVAEIVNKIRVLISGSKYRTPNPRKISVPVSTASLDTIPMQVSTTNYRKTLLARGNCKCAFCGCKLNNKNSNIDHVYPVSKGGKNIPSNMVISCERCNSTKGSRTLEEWAADILAVHK